jgi:aconitase A
MLFSRQFWRRNISIYYLDKNIPQSTKKQTLMNFINIGDGSSRDQAAMLRSFGV